MISRLEACTRIAVAVFYGCSLVACGSSSQPPLSSPSSGEQSTSTVSAARIAPPEPVRAARTDGKPSAPIAIALADTDPLSLGGQYPLSIVVDAGVAGEAGVLAFTVGQGTFGSRAMLALMMILYPLLTPTNTYRTWKNIFVGYEMGKKANTGASLKQGNYQQKINNNRRNYNRQQQLNRDYRARQSGARMRNRSRPAGGRGGGRFGR